MANQTAVLSAQAAVTELLRDWATHTFPGITDLAYRHHANGSDPGRRPELIGNWNGVWLCVTSQHNTYGAGDAVATPVALCDCCGKFAPDFESGDVVGVMSLADFARSYATDPRPTMPQCYDCQWLHKAQTDARKASRSAFARWRFEFVRQQSVEQVLSRHGRTNA